MHPITRLRQTTQHLVTEAMAAVAIVAGAATSAQAQTPAPPGVPVVRSAAATAPQTAAQAAALLSTAAARHSAGPIPHVVYRFHVPAVPLDASPVGQALQEVAQAMRGHAVMMVRWQGDSGLQGTVDEFKFGYQQWQALTALRDAVFSLRLSDHDPAKKQVSIFLQHVQPHRISANLALATVPSLRAQWVDSHANDPAMVSIDLVYQAACASTDAQIRQIGATLNRYLASKQESDLEMLLTLGASTEQIQKLRSAPAEQVSEVAKQLSGQLAEPYRRQALEALDVYKTNALALAAKDLGLLQELQNLGVLPQTR